MSVLCLLMLLLSIRGFESTYTLQTGDLGLSFRQQSAPVQERIINTDHDTVQSVEDNDYSENDGGTKCEIGKLFYLTEEGRLMRCSSHQFSIEEQPSRPTEIAQGSPHLVFPNLPSLPSLGLTFWAGARMPEAPLIQNQDNTDIESDEGLEKKKPVVIKPKPVVVQPVHKPKPVLIKPVQHKPLLHPHLTHHKHPHKPLCLHAAVPGLVVYHQTSVNTGHQEGNVNFREEQLGLNNVYSVPYWYLIPPHREVSISLPIGAENALRRHGTSEEIRSEDLKEAKETARDEQVGDISSERLLVDEDKNHIMTVKLPVNSPVEPNVDLTTANNTDDSIAEQRNVQKSQSPNGNDENGKEAEKGIEATDGVVNDHTESGRILEDATDVDGYAEFLKHENEQRADTVYDQNVERNTENSVVANNEEDGQGPELETEKSLSEGPDVMEDNNGELEEAHIRRNREAPGIPIDILNDQQIPSSSILDRNTLLTIMSSLKEQYLKNAEPDQKKLIEDAFDRLHCSVRDMKNSDERPVRKKIDGPKKATLKLLAERAQPLIDEPDYYSDAADDVSAEPSFLELLNVATRHKGKQSIESV